MGPSLDVSRNFFFKSKGALAVDAISPWQGPSRDTVPHDAVVRKESKSRVRKWSEQSFVRGLSHCPVVSQATQKELGKRKCFGEDILCETGHLM